LAIFSASLLILTTVTFSILFSFFFSKIQSLIATLISLTFLDYYNGVFSESFNLKDLGTFKILGLILHIFLPRIGVINQLTKDLLLGNTPSINFWVEIPHFFLTFSFLVVICHYFLKKKEF
jgi:hypothetical protein